MPGHGGDDHVLEIRLLGKRSQFAVKCMKIERHHDLDARIPPQLYVAVAELLAWLYRIEQGGDAGTAPIARDLPESLRPRPAAGTPENETAP